MVELTLTTNARFSGLHGAYAFYSFQIVEFTATLSLSEAGSTANLPVVFRGVGVKPGLQLQPYGHKGSDWYPVPGHDDEVQVYMTQPDAFHGVATLRALVVGQTLVAGTVSASMTSPQCASNSLPYSTYGVYAQMTSYPGILDASDVDQTPSSSAGNYLVYRFQVMADGSDDEIQAYSGLPNMCVRLTEAGQDAGGSFLQDVDFYDDYDALKPLVVNAGTAPLSLDVVTDADGVARLYVCAQGGKTTCASLLCQAGIIESEVGPILVADTQAFGTSPPAPFCENPVALNDAGSSTIEATVPQDYDGADPDDVIFLFCNGRFQSVGTLSQVRFPLQLACVRSASPPYADTISNELYYVATSAGMVRVSSIFPFGATGAPPAAAFEPIATAFADVLTAPSLVEAADGWPVNCTTVADGLTVSVPYDTRMRLGDQVAIEIVLNGYRLSSQEPTGMSLPMAGGEPWPWSLVVTSLARRQGCIEWRYQPYHFLGFGQLQASDDSSGTVGTLAARYYVSRAGIGVAYCSEVLTIGIDTIAPSGRIGMNDGAAITLPF